MFLVLVTVGSIVGHECIPMFLAKVTVLTGVTHLWNMFVLEASLAFLAAGLLIFSGFYIGFSRRFVGFLKLLNILESLDRTA